jgi:hypothetical protein
MIARRTSVTLQTASLFSVLALALTACTYDSPRHQCMNDNCGAGGGGYTPPADTVPESTIDTGATMGEIQAGEGAGTFVEYLGDGRWHVFTACDTKLSGADCQWDIITSVADGDEITSFDEDRLEGSDFLDFYNQSTGVRLVADTTNDFDGYYFDATSGATVRVDVYLDGAPAPRFIYWIGDGGVHSGAPSNPVDLKPSTK